MNKVRGGDGIPTELFQILILKCCTQCSNKFGKLSRSHRPGKGEFSFQFQRKTMPHYVPHNALLSHTSKVMLKILQARPQKYVNQELQMYKLDLEKAEESEIKLPTSVGS